MRKTKEVLRLHFGLGMSRRDIAKSLGMSHSTVGDVIRRAKAIGLSWPLPQELCEAELERQMYTQRNAPRFARPPIDMQWIHRELARKGVTLQLLWMEYKQAHPDGYQYSQCSAEICSRSVRVMLLVPVGWAGYNGGGVRHDEPCKLPAR
ncbi:MAG: hypothetical protein NUV99_01080 [Clostridia bacterium]|jgi:predicted transcriptional regulator|nr:hypothetical protein [Clostridia bacterium]